LLPLASQIHAAFVFGSVAKQTVTAALEYGDTFMVLLAATEQLGRISQSHYL
jgi:hypothetical protein